MGECDHILGVKSTKIICKVTGETLTSFREFVIASEVNWKDDGIINLFFDDHFKFCPLCGYELGEFGAGGRSEDMAIPGSNIKGYVKSGPGEYYLALKDPTDKFR